MANLHQIGDFLIRIKRPIQLQPDKDYKLVTIKMNHKGVVLRGTKKGGEIKSKMYEVKKGDFILSGIDARNGAFGIVPEELDGAIVTNDFWYFKIDENIISKKLFFELTSTSWFDEICNRGSDGTTQRIRLQKDKFFIQTIPIPEKQDQPHILNKIQKFKKGQSELFDEIQSQKTLVTQLKQSILQEAVQGKLTRDWRARHPELISGDNDAATLLENIKVEKAQLVKEKKIKKEKPLPPITEDEIPFDLPEGWVWCRLGNITNIKSGKRIHASDYREDGIPFLRSGEIGALGRGETIKKPLYISNKKYQEIKSRFGIPKKGDVLIACIGGSIGNTWIVDDREFYFKDGNLVLLESSIFFEENYLLSYLNCPFFWNETILNATDSSYNALTIIKLNEAIFPLPPLNEQKTLVNKIEALMEKCSGLEKQITKSEAHAQMLMQAVLKGAFEGEKDEVSLGMVAEEESTYSNPLS